jgi:RES domain-containing protein
MAMLRLCCGIWKALKTAFTPDVFAPIDSRFWRMLTVRWQREPLSGAGAGAVGGRWNRLGQPALYLSVDHSTAVSEFHQSLVRPGTLVGYDIKASTIADLTSPTVFDALSVDSSIVACDWRSLWRIDGMEPPTWSLVDQLCLGGAQGALVPSQQQVGGVNLVLWRWSDTAGAGAVVRVIDPNAELSQ